MNLNNLTLKMVLQQSVPSWNRVISCYRFLISVLVLIWKAFPGWRRSTNRGFLFENMRFNREWLSKEAYSLLVRSGLDLKMKYLLKFSFSCMKRAVSPVLFSPLFHKAILMRNVCDIEHLKTFRKANRENTLKMPTYFWIICLIYFQ